MKNINYLNYFFIGIPTLLILLGYLTNQSFGNLVGYGLLFTILTGLFQVIIGTKMSIHEPKDKMLQIYIISVILFFAIWLFNGLFLSSDILYFILLFIPPVLAIYLSIIIYKKRNK
ncbi:hypothetical protein SAMN05443543_10846 [Flavobacterium flevense]|uniref:Uncharacterized protein n=1 Tax=Flavobacterium flevense TaxID=983 RepID=A0A4Y4AVZ9_9FLAO|nr:hypothetical protein FFL01_19370 [Flavobacterium flevense]SHL97751.1 hypothetical protein SAMN05443543_10846 [Flavobacterium flevense]